MRKIVLIAHNLRSCHNVGSLFRTAEGLGVSKLYLTGYTPYPSQTDDERLPHEQRSITKRIVKTSLGAEQSLAWQHFDELSPLINSLRQENYIVAALEQTSNATSLPDYSPGGSLALIVGRETLGLEDEVLKLCDTVLQIPMYGQKESFNVAQAAAMAMYHFRFFKNQ